MSGLIRLTPTRLKTVKGQDAIFATIKMQMALNNGNNPGMSGTPSMTRIVDLLPMYPPTDKLIAIIQRISINRWDVTNQINNYIEEWIKTNKWTDLAALEMFYSHQAESATASYSSYVIKNNDRLQDLVQLNSDMIDEKGREFLHIMGVNTKTLDPDVCIESFTSIKPKVGELDRCVLACAMAVQYRDSIDVVRFSVKEFNMALKLLLTKHKNNKELDHESTDYDTARRIARGVLIREEHTEDGLIKYSLLSPALVTTEDIPTNVEVKGARPNRSARGDDGEKVATYISTLLTSDTFFRKRQSRWW